MLAGPEGRRRWVESGRFLDLCSNGIRFRIWVREAGDPAGPAVLFFHGFPSSSWDWVRIEPALADTHRLLYFDFLGFGASQKPRHHRYSIDEQAELAQGVAESFGLERFHLVAHDYGTTVALQWLSRRERAARLCSLTLLNGGIYPQLHRARVVQKLLDSPAGPLVARLMTKQRFERTLQGVLAPEHRLDAAEIDAQWDAICENGGHRLGHRLIHYMADRRKNAGVWPAALESSTVPLAFTWGMLDPISGAHVIDYVEPRLTHPATVTRLLDVGHYPQLEAPDRVAAALEGFLGRN